MPSRTSSLNCFAAEFLRFFEWNARLELSEKKKRLGKRKWRTKLKTYLDCIPCFVRQALEASRMATNDEVKCPTIARDIRARIGDIVVKG